MPFYAIAYEARGNSLLAFLPSVSGSVSLSRMKTGVLEAYAAPTQL
jgi:hypothetical protein